jgi:predicted KAP-like P-loop ATPase
VFRSGISFEVNPVDLIALEALRVFVPGIYESLPDLKNILTDEPRFMRKEEKKEDAAALTALLECAPQDLRPQVQNIPENLFPPAASVLSNSHDSEGNNDWFRSLRVCAHEVFDRYFQFSTPTGDISQSELDAVMALVSDRDALSRKFVDLRERGLLEVALDRLDYYKDKLPIQAA